MPDFAWPWVFVLLPLPWLMWRWLPPAQPVRALRLPFADVHLEAAVSRRASRGKVLLLALAWVLLLAAAARPEWLGPPQPVAHSGRSMMLAVDISGSMSTPDMRFGGRPVSRFAAVEAIAGEFITHRQGDRLGLVLFGSQAYLVTPVTYDLDAVRAQLRGAAVGLAGKETAIGDAIAVAVKRLRKLPAKARVLVLLTDGVNNSGSLSPRQAAKIAKAAGVRIYTIGIGADRMQVPGLFGMRTINPSAQLNAAMLKSIAQSTGGQFFRATDSQQLSAAYQRIDALEPLTHKGRPLRPRHELFIWPLGAALVLFLLALVGRWQLREATA
ncbi:MAG TPA: VWA domain-containing protein [Rhodanobacteraceae bacterium]|nr:VWA domain-containing protein [Rhodanobacteraceae bacterium]